MNMIEWFERYFAKRYGNLYLPKMVTVDLSQYNKLVRWYKYMAWAGT